jgi:hypothetical protein
MSEHPGRYGRVSPARILELLPNGGSGRRYKEDLLFTTHEIDRKIVGSEGGAWFGAVRDRPAPARSAPAMGADEQLQLQQLLGRSRDPVTGEVAIPYGCLLDWNAVVGKNDEKNLVKKNWSHLQTLAGLSFSSFDSFVHRRPQAPSSLDAPARRPSPTNAHSRLTVFCILLTSTRKICRLFRKSGGDVMTGVGSSKGALPALLPGCSSSRPRAMRKACRRPPPPPRAQRRAMR